MPAILAWIGSFFTASLASATARWIATKVLLTALMVTILPIVLNNFIHKLIGISFGIVDSQAGSLASSTLTLSGLGAWFAINLSLPECVSIILTAIAIKFTLGLIPFVRT